MDYWLNIVTQIGIFAMLAMSLNLMTGLTGLLQLGHVGFFAAGAYAAGLLSIYSTFPSLGPVNFVLGAVAAMAAAGVLALLIGLPCLRLRGDYLAIATLGFGEILRQTLNNVDFPGCPLTGAEPFGGATGIGLPNPTDYTAAYTADYSPWWLIWLGVAVVYVLLLNLKRSALGRALMCIREDEVAARAMGIHVPRYKMLAFLVSAVVAGLAGAMFAHNSDLGIRFKPDQFDLLKTLDLLLMVVLGGLGSLSGSVLAAGVLVLTPELLRFLPDLAGIKLAEHRQVLYAILLIVLIRLVPGGILGTRELPAWVARAFRKRTAEGEHEQGS